MVNTSFLLKFYNELVKNNNTRISVFLAGKEIGKSKSNLIGSPSLLKKNKITKLVDFFQTQNIGSLNLKSSKPDKKEFVFKLKNSAFKTKLKKPSCHIVTGFLAGIFENKYKKYAGAMETKCVSKGDPHCEFKVKIANK